MFNEVVIPLSFMLFTLNLKHSALNKNMVVNVYCLMGHYTAIQRSTASLYCCILSDNSYETQVDNYAWGSEYGAVETVEDASMAR